MSNKKNIKLSIIIPHYNSPDLLVQLLLTIPKDKNIEVIVIDDKSEDKYVNYIQNIQKSKEYIDFILLKNETSKKGAGTARNIGLEKANGEWLLFADADDYFSEKFYENVSRYFESKNQIVFFKPTSIYIDTGEIADRHINVVNILDKFMMDKNKINELNLRYNVPGPICKLIKKDFLDRNEIKFEEVIASNDIMFSTKLGYFMQRFEVSEYTLYSITRNHISLTANMSKEIFKTRMKTKVKYANFLKNNLTEEEFNILNISFSGWLFSSLKYGIVEFINTFLFLKKEKVKIFDKRIWDIKFVLKKLISRYVNYRKNKKYYVKS